MGRKGIFKNIVLPIIVVILTMLAGYWNVFGIWDMTISDRLNQNATGVNKKIFIIGIDDKTLQEYGAITSWSREVSGKLVETLNQYEDAKPKVIAFDIIYSEEADAEGDFYFAEACKKAGNVVLASNISFKGQPDVDDEGNAYYNAFHIDSVLYPYKQLQKETSSGFANAVIDKDGYVRQSLLRSEWQGEVQYSFSYQIYRMYQESIGAEVVVPPTYGNANLFYFSYSGKPGDYTKISMSDVLSGSVDTRLFKDSIVLVGAYAVGMQDSFKTAIAHNNEMYGVEIHANIVQALLNNSTQLPVSNTFYTVIVGLLSGLFAIFMMKEKMVWSTVIMIVVIVSNMIVNKWLYQMGYIVPILLLPVSIGIIYIGQLLAGYISERMRRKRVVDAFKQYVAPQVVEKISKDKNFELVLGGENRHIAVLFVDIRGFTTMSESLTPEEVVEILNEYLNLTTTSIFNNEGTLDKFVGDATMAVFNAPFDLDDYIFKAVCAAWDMKQGATALAEKFEKRFGKSVAFGIGVNSGNAVVGNIGCDFRMDYTAIGDTVNTAARLESNAKKGQILISKDVYDAIHERIDATLIGELSLKGKIQGVTVYEVEGVHRK